MDVNIPMALDLYELDVGDFPSTLDHLMDNRDGKSNWKGPYLKKLMKDPWGKGYNYRYPGQHNKYGYDLYSAGPDGQEGTADDIANW